MQLKDVSSLRKPEGSQRCLWEDISNQSPGRRLKDLQVSPLWDVFETLYETSQGCIWDASMPIGLLLSLLLSKTTYFEVVTRRSLIGNFAKGLCIVAIQPEMIYCLFITCLGILLTQRRKCRGLIFHINNIYKIIKVKSKSLILKIDFLVSRNN